MGRQPRHFPRCAQIVTEISWRQPGSEEAEENDRDQMDFSIFRLPICFLHAADKLRLFDDKEQSAEDEAILLDPLNPYSEFAL